jgi:hypothetical protein
MWSKPLTTKSYFPNVRAQGARPGLPVDHTGKSPAGRHTRAVCAAGLVTTGTDGRRE